MMRICIGIPTFNRQEELRVLLNAIGQLAAPPDDIAIDVVVFDNDRFASARSLVTVSRVTAPFHLRYVHVPVTGLSNVRNAALDFAISAADVLVMIDDDERPEPQWLNELIRVRRSTGSTVVIGPVRAILSDNAPQWLRAFREREYPLYGDSSSLRDGWSSNFLLDVREAAEMNLRFDSAMNRTGGEDQLFFRQLLTLGGTIRYSANAVVWESLPPNRCSLTSILKRSFRRGGSLTMCDQRLNGRFLNCSLRLAKGMYIVVFGAIALLPIFFICGTSAAVSASCEIARGLGMLAAFFGVRSLAYGHRASR